MCLAKAYRAVVRGLIFTQGISGAVAELRRGRNVAACQIRQRPGFGFEAFFARKAQVPGIKIK